MSQNLLVAIKGLKKMKSVTESMILNHLRLGITCKRKDKWIGKVRASSIEEKKIKRNQKIKVEFFCQEENINKQIQR